MGSLITLIPLPLFSGDLFHMLLKLLQHKIQLFISNKKCSAQFVNIFTINSRIQFLVPHYMKGLIIIVKRVSSPWKSILCNCCLLQSSPLPTELRIFFKQFYFFIAIGKINWHSIDTTGFLDHIVAFGQNERVDFVDVVFGMNRAKQPYYFC